MSQINITSKQQRKLIKIYRAVLGINFEQKISNKKRLACSSVTIKLKTLKLVADYRLSHYYQLRGQTCEK